MTPEEKFNNDVWYVLQEIKKRSLYTTKGKPVEYKIFTNIIVAGDSIPTSENEAEILEKLQEEGAIKIKDAEELGIHWTDTWLFYLEILRPKFDEIYCHYEELNTKSGNSNSGDMLSLSAGDRKKICVLEKLKEEWDLVPKAPFREHISFGYSYTHPANEARVSQQKYYAWIKECGISDWYEFENILTGFMQEGLIDKFNSMDESR